jgi:hypothetical protein
VGNNKRYVAACLGLLCALAAALALLHQGAGKRAGCAGGFKPEDVSALRVCQDGVERLPVYRVVRGGEVLHDRRSEAGGPVLRIDFEVGGEHITLWVRDAPQPPPR